MSDKPSWFRFKFRDEYRKHMFIKTLLRLEFDFGLVAIDNLLDILIEKENDEYPSPMSDKCLSLCMVKDISILSHFINKDVTEKHIYNTKREALIRYL